jgi:hypothetical protein
MNDRHPSPRCILAADVAGFSRLMGLDEAGTARALCEPRGRQSGRADWPRPPEQPGRRLLLRRLECAG